MLQWQTSYPLHTFLLSLLPFLVALPLRHHATLLLCRPSSCLRAHLVAVAVYLRQQLLAQVLRSWLSRSLAGGLAAYGQTYLSRRLVLR